MGNLKAIQGVKEAPYSLLQHELISRKRQQKKEAVILASEGCTVADIAVTLGQHPRMVARWTKQTRDQLRRERNNKIRNLREQGMVLLDIAKKMNVSYRTVWEAVNSPTTKQS